MRRHTTGEDVPASTAADTDPGLTREDISPVEPHTPSDLVMATGAGAPHTEGSTNHPGDTAMLERLRSHLSIVITAVVTAAVFAGGPSLAQAAFDAVNSDKVDGKHAVGAGATPTKRAGKLVATNGDGLLPNDIIAQAPDADLLDGLDSSQFLAADGTAADAETLDGVDSTDFLRTSGKAANSDALDGLDSADFLRSSGKAADSDALDGLDSADFLRSNGKAGDSNLLDGINSTGFLQGTGNTKSFTQTIGSGQQSVAFDLPGFPGTIRMIYTCPADPTTQAATFYWTNFPNATLDIYGSRAGTATYFQTVSPAGGQMFIRDGAAPGAGDILTWTIIQPSSNRMATVQSTSLRTATTCTVSAQALTTAN
jgi:hypothetical protein